MKKQKYELDKDELEILSNLEKGKFRPVKEIKVIKKMQNAAQKQLKSERITIRLNKEDLEKVSQEAGRLGIPYQSLIGSVIHRYANKHLLDVQNIEILKTLKKQIFV